MSHIFPELFPTQDQIHAPLSYKSPYEADSTPEPLFIAKTAILNFSEGNPYVLQKTASEEREIAISIGFIGKMFTEGYPRLNAQWPIYDFWRKGAMPSRADKLKLLDSIGSETVEITKANDDDDEIEFTALNALFRLFEDTPEADHLEIRGYNSVVLWRIPRPEAEVKLHAEEYPSEFAKYMSFWVPELAMDRNALAWHKALEAKKDEELAKFREELIANGNT